MKQVCCELICLGAIALSELRTRLVWHGFDKIFAGSLLLRYAPGWSLILTRMHINDRMSKMNNAELQP